MTSHEHRWIEDTTLTDTAITLTCSECGTTRHESRTDSADHQEPHP